MEENTTEPCEFLEWDSNFFGHRIARIRADCLTRESWEEIRQWCRRNEVDCLYFFANPDDRATLFFAAENRFVNVDIRFTFEKPLAQKSLDLSPLSEGISIRPFRADDLSVLKNIAGKSHGDGRFYFDPRFAREKCAAFYETWIENSCNGMADAVWVAEYRGKPAGYLTGHLREGGEGNLGLLGVEEELRHRGVGGVLIRHALQWAREKGCDRMTVVTQGRNINAQRLFQKSGFLSRSLLLTFHYWLESPS